VDIFNHYYLIHETPYVPLWTLWEFSISTDYRYDVAGFHIILLTIDITRKRLWIGNATIARAAQVYEKLNSSVAKTNKSNEPTNVHVWKDQDAQDGELIGL
jgi:hypothetical protein